ncbi:MAG: class I SAM-dependent methyltransferase [Bacteroidales bacterium]|nr:class I SAM-dependent methyltransferase [Bacteroidales bacterium]
MNSSKTRETEASFSGRKLYGDDFSQEQIARWFEEEAEAYAELGNREISDYSYQYHALNRIHGFRHIKKIAGFDQVLGLGAAWGHEFLPVIHKIKNLVIAEPSENLRSEEIGSLKPVYIKPEIKGTLEFEDNTFDLVSCFGTLHHIPNVTFVLGELIRVLKPGGHLLLREPIISLGDWNRPRPGLTSNERGIPVSHFEEFFKKQPVERISRSYCLSMTYQFQKILKNVLKKPLITYSWYIHADRLLSSLLGWNVRYHALKKRHRIAPSNIFYVIRKI